MAGKIFTKKSMFFSIIVLSVILLLILNYKITYSHSHQTKNSVSNRITTINNFIEDSLKDLERALYIASYRSLLSINQYIASNREFVNLSLFDEAIINGTLFGSYNQFTDRDNLNDWAESIKKLSEDFNINFNITFLNLSVKQISPWDLEFKIFANFKVSNKIKDIRFDFNESVKTCLSIINFDDPLYSVYSYGTYTNKINKSYFDYFSLDPEKINILIQNKQYIAAQDAPSYLDRLQGIIKKDKYGIMSFVNQNDLGSKYIYNRSDIDYIYWLKDIEAYPVENISEPWFKLDQEHINIWNLTKIE